MGIALLFNLPLHLFMKLKLFLQIPAAVLMMFCLSSCDGGGDGGGDGDTVPDRDGVSNQYAPRYPDNLDPSALALFPDSLVVTPADRLVLSPTAFTIPEIPFPTTNGEGDGVILPFAATSMVTDSQTYTYRDDGLLTEIALSATKDRRGTNSPSSYVDGLIGLLDFNNFIITDFFDDINDILANPVNAFWITSRGPEGLPDADQPGGRPTVEEMRELIGTFLAPDSLAAELRDVVGYIGVNNPNAVGLAGFGLTEVENRYQLAEVHLPVENFMVLKERIITLENTNSTNQTLLDSSEISGDYQIADKYDVVFLNAVSPVNVFTLTANTGAEKPATEVYEDAVKEDIDASAVGPFTLELSTLGSSDPNQ